MFDATKLPAAPCDPKALQQAKKPEPAQPFARAPAGNGHEAALQQKGTR